MSKLVKSYCMSDRNVDLTEDRLKSILGSNERVLKLYNGGQLGTYLLTGVEDIYRTLSVGCKTTAPRHLIGLFQVLSKLEVIESENFYSLEISNLKNSSDIMISMMIDEDEPFMIILTWKDGKWVVRRDPVQRISEETALVIGNLLERVIDYVNNVIKVPTYSITYIFKNGNITRDKIGSGSNYYVGFAEANMDNSVPCIDVIEDEKRGEYAIIFLED